MQREMYQVNKYEYKVNQKIIKGEVINQIKGNETKERLTPCKPIRFCP